MLGDGGGYCMNQATVAESAPHHNHQKKTTFIADSQQNHSS